MAPHLAPWGCWWQVGQGHIPAALCAPLNPCGLGGPESTSRLGIVSACRGQEPQEAGASGEAGHTRWEAEFECPVLTTWHPLGPAGQKAHNTLPPAREGDGRASAWTRPLLPRVNLPLHRCLQLAGRQTPCVPHLQCALMLGRGRDSPGEVGDPRITGWLALRPPALGPPWPQPRPGEARGTRVQKSQRAEMPAQPPWPLPHVSALFAANFPRAVAVHLTPWSPAGQPQALPAHGTLPGVGSARLSATLSGL